jgi:hypothetical protein
VLLGAFFDVTNPKKVGELPYGAVAHQKRPRAWKVGGSIVGIAARDFGIRTDFGGTGSMVVAASAVGTSGRGTRCPRNVEKASRRGHTSIRALQHELRLEWQGGQLSEGFCRPRLDDSPSGQRAGAGHQQFAAGEGPARFNSDQRRRSTDLEGEQSPWEERVMGRWKRRVIKTNLSVE